MNWLMFGLLFLNLTPGQDWELRAPGSSVSDRDFTGSSFVGADLSQVQLHRVVLTNTNFSDSQWQGANWLMVQAAESDWVNADLSESTLARTNFARAILIGVNFNGAVLTHVRFDYADLTDADMRGADLQETFLGWAELTGARFDRETRLPIAVDEAFERGMIYENED